MSKLVDMLYKRSAEADKAKALLTLELTRKQPSRYWGSFN